VLEQSCLDRLVLFKLDTDGVHRIRLSIDDIDYGHRRQPAPRRVCGGATPSRQRRSVHHVVCPLMRAAQQSTQRERLRSGGQELGAHAERQRTRGEPAAVLDGTAKMLSATQPAEPHCLELRGHLSHANQLEAPLQHAPKALHSAGVKIMEVAS